MKRRERSPNRETPKESAAEVQEEEDILEALRGSQLTDPLTDVTRRERKSLLAVSLISVAITVGNLIPTEISTLGVKVSSAERAGLLLTLALTLFYFLIAFIVYGLADLNDWRLRIKLFYKKLRRAIEPLQRLAAQTSSQGEEGWKELQRLSYVRDEGDLAKELITASRARIGFELAVPIVFGIFSLGLVLDTFVSVSAPATWKVALTLPWSILPLFAVVLAFGIIWWRWHWKKTAPARQAKKFSSKLAAITEKTKRIGTFDPTSPERKELMDEISKDLSNLNRE